MAKIKIARQNEPGANKKLANLFLFLFLVRLAFLIVTVVLFGAETVLMSRRSKATSGDLNEFLRYLNFISTYDQIRNICAWVTVGILLVQLAVFYLLSPYEKNFVSAIGLGIFTVVCSIAAIFLTNVNVGLAILLAILEGVAKIGYTYFYYYGCSKVTKSRDGELGDLWEKLFTLYAISIGLRILSVVLVLSANGAAEASMAVLILSVFTTALPIIILYREVKYLPQTIKVLK